jgi:tetratricopeptide (TPR) repeat protein
MLIKLSTFYLALSLVSCGGPQRDYVSESNQALAQGRAKDATQLATLAVEESADKYTARKSLAQAHRAVANQAEAAGDFPAAMEALRNAIAAEPSPALRCPDALAAANIAARIQNNERRLEFVGMAVGADPSNEEARKEAAAAYDEAGDPSAAIPHYLWLWEADHSKSNYGLRLAGLYAAENRHRDASVVYAEVLESDPENVQAAFGRIESLSKIKRFDEAERAFKTLLNRYPHNPAVLYRWADFLEFRGRQLEADEVRRGAEKKLPGVKRRRMRKLH